MNNFELPINKIIEKINNASDAGIELTLTPQEVQELSKEIGDMVMIPVLTWEQVAKLPGKPINTKKTDE